STLWEMAAGKEAAPCSAPRRRGRLSVRQANAAVGEDPVQEPFAVVDPVAVIAIDPHRLAAGVLGDEVVAAHVDTIPPARFDPFRPVPQHPRPRFEEMAERLRLGEQPDGPG